ncbi:MAG TPA: helix-turn-helix domain-containing protein [Clostridia bacterium]|jgi:two-component system response regulator YesN|nr:helix-turn-helix domain-containing protein [Clostridia bacterium]
MYKILLADDEGIELDALTFILEKSFPGQCSIETAKTGYDAVELAERFRPDIAVMDIRMPGINGMEAIQAIQATSPGILFIVLTAYDKFEYAKEAIRLSVFEFLTKPVNRLVFADVLRRAMGKVDSERKARNTALKTRERMENMLPVLENSFVYLLLMQSDDPAAYARLFDLLGIDAKYATIMVLELTRMVDGDMLDLNIKTSEGYSAIRGLIKESFPCVVGPAMANRIIIIRPADEPENEYYERLLLIEQGRALAHRVEDRCGVECKLGIGPSVPLGRICESYTQAVKALKHCKGIVSHYNDLPISSDYETGYPAEREKHLEEMILRGDAQAAISDAEVFFQWMVERYPDHDMAIRLKVLEFVMRAEYNAFHEGGGLKYHFLDRDDYLQAVLATETYEELKVWFLRKIAESARNVSTKADEKANRVIAKARAFIDRNFSRDLTLEEVSREVHVSPYYFSKLFKEQTGDNFINYLTQKRVDTAKQLLADGRLNVKAICTEIGYNDPNYFSRLFKKFEGMTPTEYREQVLNISDN